MLVWLEQTASEMWQYGYALKLQYYVLHYSSKDIDHT